MTVKNDYILDIKQIKDKIKDLDNGKILIHFNNGRPVKIEVTKSDKIDYIKLK